MITTKLPLPTDHQNLVIPSHPMTKVIGWGHGVPSRIMMNQEIETMVQTSDQWIQERTGIKQRYIVGKDENTATLAIAAARQALKQAGLEACQIDGIIVATTTPVHSFPATANLVQGALGSKGFSFDIQAACSGFIYALSCANAMILAKQASTMIVIGSETMSKIVDWTDRNTCVLFGDGAGALILQGDNNEEGQANAHLKNQNLKDTNRISPTDNASIDLNMQAGILSTHLYSDGSFYDLLYVDDQDAQAGHPGSIRMNGGEIYKHAVGKFVQAMGVVLTNNNITVKDLDWFVPHQANSRIIQTDGPTTRASYNKCRSLC